MSLRKQLLEAMSSRQMYSVFTMDDLEGGYTGFVSQVNEHEILIRMINNDGSEGGYYLGKVNDIICCSKNDRELMRRQRLWEGEEKRKLCFSHDGKNMMDDIFQYAMENKELVSVLYQEQEYSGQILHFTNEILVMEECTCYGESDGRIWLRKEWIDAIEIGTQELQARKKLRDFESVEAMRGTGDDFYEKLKLYEGKKKLFEFHIEDNLDKFYVGEAVHVTEKEMVIKSVDCDGNEDGYAVFALENIRCIYEESKYLLKMEKIRKRNTKENQLKIMGEFLSEEFLAYAQNRQCLLMLEVMGTCYYGRIKGWDEVHICLAAVDEYGAADGQIWVLREWVEIMQIYSRRLRRME